MYLPGPGPTLQQLAKNVGEGVWSSKAMHWNHKLEKNEWSMNEGNHFQIKYYMFLLLMPFRKLKLKIFRKHFWPKKILSEKIYYCRMSANPESTTESIRVEPAPKRNPGSRRQRELDWKEGQVIRVHVKHHTFFLLPCFLV